MFQPKYLICPNKKSFFPEEAVCLGSQLKDIVKKLNGLIDAHIWLCADIDALSPIPKKLGIDSFQLQKIGNDYSLINLCENIDQFLSGVFIAVRENLNLEYSSLYIDTEDEQFRSINLEGVLIEIRAFDTSYFEIYSEDMLLIKKLAEIYNVKIEESR